MFYQPKLSEEQEEEIFCGQSDGQQERVQLTTLNTKLCTHKLIHVLVSYFILSIEFIYFISSLPNSLLYRNTAH